MAKKKLHLLSDMKLLMRLFNLIKNKEGKAINFKPVVLSTVAYWYMRRSDSWSEATRTMYPAFGQSEIARRLMNCEHQCGEGLGSGGTVNTSELLINIVTVGKPKMLTGFTKRYVTKLQYWKRYCTQMISHR